MAVYFCVRNKNLKGCQIRYQAVRDYAKADEKREFLSEKTLEERVFDKITPSVDGNWINQTKNGFESLVPVATKAAKAAKSSSQEQAIFKLYSLGVVTARDEWVYSECAEATAAKVEYLIAAYNADSDRLKAFRKSPSLSDSNRSHSPVHRSNDAESVAVRIAKQGLRVGANRILRLVCLTDSTPT